MDSLLAGFERINYDLTSEEINSLKKFTGLTSAKGLIESFFQELINCNKARKPFFSSENWKSLSKTEKIALGEKVLQWYRTLLLFYPEYLRRCVYTTEDYLKLLITFKSEDLVSPDDYSYHLTYLESIKKDKIYEGNSEEFVSWINDIILLLKSEQEQNDDGSFIFPGPIIDILTAYHGRFNALIFEELRLKEFLNLFSLNGECKIVFKKELKGHFHYSISFIEKYHELPGDFNEWFSKKIGGTYKNSKGRPKKNSNITREIESFFQEIMKQYEL